MFHVCHAVLPVHCRLMVTYREMANLLAFLYMLFFVGFLSFWHVVPGSGDVLDCIDS